MLHYALVFLLIALLAGLFGYGVISVTAASIAKVLLALFLAAFVVSILTGRRLWS
jgi:uncharacterized membrane protein YtjA (UPF0391 family)